jgi:HicB-like protein involved in pilus formation
LFFALRDRVAMFCRNSNASAMTIIVGIDTFASIAYFASINAEMSLTKEQEVSRETRINVFVPSELHRRLKATLALQGKSLRQWVIESAEETAQGKSRVKRSPKQ